MYQGTVSSEAVPFFLGKPAAQVDPLADFRQARHIKAKEMPMLPADDRLIVAMDVPNVAREGAAGSDMKILAVTILTSLDRNDLDMSCIKEGAIPDLVTERAGLAMDAGADGVIASPQEAALIRALPEAQGKLIVTPGVRPVGADLGDQKRVTTPAQAMANGADHVVVGRPVWQAEHPEVAVQNILSEIA